MRISHLLGTIALLSAIGKVPIAEAVQLENQSELNTENNSINQDVHSNAGFIVYNTLSATVDEEEILLIENSFSNHSYSYVYNKEDEELLKEALAFIEETKGLADADNESETQQIEEIGYIFSSAVKAGESMRTEHFATRLLEYAEVVIPEEALTDFEVTNRYHWTNAVNGGKIVTRLEAVEAVFNLVGATPDPNAKSLVTDVDSIALNTLCDMGIIKLTEDRFDPHVYMKDSELEALFDSVDYYLNEVYGKTDFRYLKPIVMEPYSPMFTAEYIESLILYMQIHQEESYAFIVNNVTPEELNEIDSTAFIVDCLFSANTNCLELSSFWTAININKTELSNDEIRFKLTLLNGSYESEEVKEKQDDFLLQIADIAQSFYDEEELDPESSDREKAKFFYDYCNHEFSYDNTKASTAYNGHGLLETTQGVCQAYTSVFNALNNMWGVETKTVFGMAINGTERHSWSFQNLDGEWLYTDATWGDPAYVDLPNYFYFAMSEERVQQKYILREYEHLANPPL